MKVFEYLRCCFTNAERIFAGTVSIPFSTKVTRASLNMWAVYLGKY